MVGVRGDMREDGREEGGGRWSGRATHVKGIKRKLFKKDMCEGMFMKESIETLSDNNVRGRTGGGEAVKKKRVFRS